MTEQLQPVYSKRIEDFSFRLNELKRKLNITSIVRISVFLAGIITCYFLFKVHIVAAVITFLVFAGVFLFLVKRYEALREAKRLNEELARINEGELKMLQGRFDHFENGKEFIDLEHPFAYDLDIVGEGSIFQYLNRTCSTIGKESLARWLKEPCTDDPEEILSRQEAVKELANLLDWRQHFQATGNLFLEKRSEKENVDQWLNEPVNLANNKILRGVVLGLPLITMALIILAFMGILHYSIPVVMVLIQGGISWNYRKIIERQHELLGNKFKMLKKYVGLFRKIETQNFESAKLTTQKKNLTSEDKTASQNFYRLARIANALDSRKSLIGVLANMITLRDLRNIIQLEQWKSTFGKDVKKWLDVIMTFDALSSFACFAYNHPDFAFPKISNADFAFKAEALGHPLIPEKERIDNDFCMERAGQVIITTGANMAGKSTFLRAIGVNLVLAMAGAPVCARSLEFSPMGIHTSMRTKDSLLRHQSYFHAELDRLKQIIEELNAGKRLFILLDEILKGTNSTDQHAGSKALIEQLIDKNVLAVIATHDLSLGALEKQHPEKISNKCFEIAIENGQLAFDYKLRDGISQNLNATYLMKKMGITI